MEVDQSFLREVFSKQPGQIMAFSSKSAKGKWQDKFFTHLSDAIDWIEGKPKNADIYFCPVKLSARRRIKKNILRSKFLYSDLDEANPSSFEDSLRPTHVWESSPGRYQCLWELSEAASPEDVESRNKALAYKLGADRGGWDLTQVLRVPGTVNNKYPSQPRVKVLWSESARSKPLNHYPIFDHESSGHHDGMGRPRLTPKKFEKLLKRYRSKLPRKALALLRATRATPGQRSDVLWYLSHTLVDSDIPSNTVFDMIRASAWNKYRDRSDEVERLTHEIDDAVQARDDEKEEKQSVDREYRSSLIVVSHADLMANPATSPGWLVDKFWTRESHGIIAGEPKSFKSTLLLDFMVSIASGEPFMDQFAVAESGPVLMVQNENSDWIMTDRLQKIMTRRKIMGKVKNVKDGIIFTPPLDLPIYYVNQQSFSFSDPAHLESIEEFVDEARPLVVMFDPLYLMFDGDMNSARDLSPALSWLLYLKQTYQTAIMLVHHWNKGGQSRRGGQRMLGSTTLHGWIESAWYLAVNDSESNEEDEDGDDYQQVASTVNLTLEREFRGAGTYPKVDLKISMGDFGDTKYDIELVKHQRSGGPAKLERGKVVDDIMGLLTSTTRPLSIRAISREITLSRKLVQEVITQQVKDKKIIRAGKGFTVRTEG